MFWQIPNLPTSSSCESDYARVFKPQDFYDKSMHLELILDKEGFTLEDLLDEEEIIQECKALNTRLINFLRDRAQVEQLLQYIIEDAPEDADNKRTFKFPFIACEILTCEIDVILKTLVDDEDLMNMFFSFLEPNRTHRPVLAGYFSKVVVCLMLRKTTSLMTYVQKHEHVVHQLVDLIGITSIMEILIRLVGADDHTCPNYMDITQWLADTNILEMILDKLRSMNSAEVNANAAEVLMTILRNAPSHLTAKLSSESFITRIISHALENSSSNTALVHSLSVCIALLDPKRSAMSVPINYIRNQHLYLPSNHVNPETLHAMLMHLGDLVNLLNISFEVNALPTSYGELRPPLGKHRLKVVEFIAVLLDVGGEASYKDLIQSGAIQIILDLFFKYPFNNSLHHLVEYLVITCLESKDTPIIDHLFSECGIIARFLQADNCPFLYSDSSAVTVPASGRQSIRVGNLGHITRICSKLVQLGSRNDHIRSYLQESGEWIAWQTNVLHERNTVENLHHWACGRPTPLHERMRDSDEEELHVQDYNVAAFANNLNQAFLCQVYENDEMDEDVYLDGGSPEVIISPRRLGADGQSYLFTNSNWFSFDDESATEPMSISIIDRMDDANLNETSSRGDGSDDEVVVGIEELTKVVVPENKHFAHRRSEEDESLIQLSRDVSKLNVADDVSHFHFDTDENEDLFSDQQLPEWVGWREASDIHVEGSTDVPTQSDDSEAGDVSTTPARAAGALAGDKTMSAYADSAKDETSSSLFEDAEFVGVEFEGRAMNGEVGSTTMKFVFEVGKHPNPYDDATAMEFSKSRWLTEPEVGIVQE